MDSETKLLRLAAALEERVGDEDFDGSSWTQRFGVPRSAIGWAPVWFASEGFDVVSLDGIEWTPVYETKERTYVGWQAVAAFFEITENAAIRLFDDAASNNRGSSRERSRQEVIDDIRMFVKDWLRESPHSWDACSSAFSL